MGPSLCLEEKAGDLQAEELHPNCEAQGWQHHVVGLFCGDRDLANHKIGGVMEKENYVDILKVHPEVLSLEAKAGTPMDLSAGQWP